MKSTRIFTTTLLALASCAQLLAADPAAKITPDAPAEAKIEAPKHPLKPLLWKVEGNSLTQPSWLFGTIHIGKGPVGTLHPAAAAALNGSDAVYTEVPMDTATQLGLVQHFIRKDGKRLSDSIGDELAKQLDAELKLIQPGLNSAVFQPLKTWAVAVTIPMLQLQLTGSKALDAIIWETAAKQDKSLGALEKPEDQFGIFDDLKEEEQIILLAQSLQDQKDSRESGDDPLVALIAAYIAGDAAAVEAEMEQQFTKMAKGDHKELGEKLLKRLLTDRNITMAKTIESKLSAQPGESHFFAVGTGHYIGKTSIVDLLKKQGYKVTRITQ